MLEREISKNIYIINYFFTILIVYMHATNIKIYDYSSNLVSKLFYYFQIIMSEDILAVCVPGFFIISGFLFYINIHEKNIKTKIKKRIKSIVIPYIIWNFISFIYFFVLTNLFSNIVNMESINISLENVVQGIFLFKYSPVNWFLFQIIIYTFLSPFLFYLSKKKGHYIIFLLLLAILNLIDYNSNYFSTSSFNVCLRLDSLFFYCLGIYFARFNNIFVKLISDINYKKSMSLFLISQIILLINIFLDFNLFFIGIVVLFLFFITIYNFITLPKLCSRLTPFFIFQCHEFILEPIEKCILILLGKYWINGLLDYFFAPVICLGFILIATIMLKRTFPKFYSILVGGR